MVCKELYIGSKKVLTFMNGLKSKNLGYYHKNDRAFGGRKEKKQSWNPVECGEALIVCVFN